MDKSLHFYFVKLKWNLKYRIGQGLSNFSDYNYITFCIIVVPIHEGWYNKTC